MDQQLSSENEEFAFDDNGLKNVDVLASRQDDSCKNYVGDKTKDELKLCNSNTVATGRRTLLLRKITITETLDSFIDYFERRVKETLFYCEEISFQLQLPTGHRQSLKTLEEDSNGRRWLEYKLYVPVGNIFKKQEAENVTGRITVTSPKVTAKYIKIKSEPSERQSLKTPEEESNGRRELEYNLDVPTSNKCKKEEAENVARGTTVGLISRNATAKRKQISSGPSEVDGGCSCPGPPSLWWTSLMMISWQQSVSFTFVILLLRLSAGVEGALTSTPVNALFLKGKTARMNCSTNLNRPVYWARTLAGSDLQQWLYYGKNGFNGNNADGRFQMDKNETVGRYDIIIADVQQKDAGQYLCIDESGIGAKASAELVITEPMTCSSQIPRDGAMGYNVFAIPQDFIQISCSLTYTGNIPPTLEWSWPGSEVQNIERAVTEVASSVTSTLKLSPTKELNNAAFQCRANIKGAAQNAIDSGIFYESETVNVKYAEFASMEVVVCPGVEWNLFCNPQCSYHFERKDNDCQCLYTYYDTRTHQKYNVTSDAVRCGRGNYALVVSIAAAGTAVAVSIITVLSCLLAKKNTKRLSSNASSESGQTDSDDNFGKAMLDGTDNSAKYLTKTDNN